MVRYLYMNASLEILPLFPIPMMVLPGEAAALHVFEPRYRELVAHCRAEPDPRGDFVMQYEEENRSPVYATAVVISRVLKEHDDGRVDLLVEGRRRMEVADRLQLQLYHSAKCREVLDEEIDWDDDLATRVYALHRQLLVTVTGDEPPDAFYQQPGGISFKVAACGGMTFTQRLKLLKSTSENERLKLVEAHLERKLPVIREVLPMLRNIAGAFSLAQAVTSQ